jgi:arginine-tRNA-protein transferase
MPLPPLIWDEFHAEHAPPEGMDLLWAEGWRHFGTHFFRYSLMDHEGGLQVVVPLRVELSRHVPTKSQRRVLRRNADIEVVIGPAEISELAQGIFSRHRERFSENVPESLAVFLSPEPARVPCECRQLRCLLEGECIAVSYFDAGLRSISSVYAVFEPAFASRSLGIFTMLKELEWARERGMEFAYPGYATFGSSHYDYKKQFTGLQGYDWGGKRWLDWSVLESSADRGTNESRPRRD